MSGKKSGRRAAEASLKSRPHRIWNLFVGLCHGGHIPRYSKYEATPPALRSLCIFLVGKLCCTYRTEKKQCRQNEKEGLQFECHHEHHPEMFVCRPRIRAQQYAVIVQSVPCDRYPAKKRDELASLHG